MVRFAEFMVRRLPISVELVFIVDDCAVLRMWLNL
jgi:hypothetical protein